MPPKLVVLVVFVSIGLFDYVAAQCAKTVVTRALANIYDFEENRILGQVTLFQNKEGAKVRVSGILTGLTPGRHGIHVHQTGNTTTGCTSVAGHYNPTLMNHGAPSDLIRHNGDLGNINADSDGVAMIELEDSRLELNGPVSVIGRALVIDANEDDLGRGGNTVSLTTGNSGPRVACGVIGVAEEQRACTPQRATFNPRPRPPWIRRTSKRIVRERSKGN